MRIYGGVHCRIKGQWKAGLASSVAMPPSPPRCGVCVCWGPAHLTTANVRLPFLIISPAICGAQRVWIKDPFAVIRALPVYARWGDRILREL